MSANGPVRICDAVNPDGVNDIMYHNWYNSANLPAGATKRAEGGWRYVARSFNPVDRAELAAGAMAVYNKFMEDTSNRLIYYTNGSHRTDLFNWVAAGNAISAITEPKGCDCSSMVCALVRLITNRAYVTSTGEGWNADESGLAAMLRRTGKFQLLSDTEHVSQCSGLMVGDILVKPKWYMTSGGVAWGGHAATVVYSEYDTTSPEYVDEPIADRAQNAGRMTSDYDFVSYGARRGVPYPTPATPAPIPTDAPSDLSEMSDFELFMLGAFITGGSALAGLEGGRSSVYFSSSQP